MSNCRNVPRPTWYYTQYILRSTSQENNFTGFVYVYILSVKTKIGILLGSRDEGQWSDPKVEPIWITATKQVVFD